MRERCEWNPMLHQAEAIAAARAGQRVKTAHSLFPDEYTPPICAHLHGWRTIACDGTTDVVECPDCGAQEIAGCNPALDPPQPTDCVNPVSVVVGAKGHWHLCATCAKLPEFRRFRARVYLCPRGGVCVTKGGVRRWRLHELLAQSHPKIRRGQVWCRTCSATMRVDPDDCLAHGWPSCCGQTMTLDAPDERAAHDRI